MTGRWPAAGPGVVLSLLAAALAAQAAAEPLDLSQAAAAGSGFGFRRGDTCIAVTALHVVKDDGIPVTVADRTGGRARAERTYANPAYDLALVTLPPDMTLTCTDRWPETAWLRDTRFGTQSLFEAIRHYPSGRETIVRLRFVGRTETTLTLGPVDRMTVRESDSGSIVMFDGKVAGIVQRVDPASDRVEVLRFDVIDQLVGVRFRGANRLRRVALDGVFRQGRAVPTWTVYARSWLEEGGHAAVVEANDRRATCRVRADVISLQPAREPNPEYAALQQRLRSCGSVPVLGATLCSQARDQQRNTPPQLTGYRVTLDVAVTGPSGQRLSKLATATHLSATRTVDRNLAEREALQEAFGQTIGPLFKDGACN